MKKKSIFLLLIILVYSVFIPLTSVIAMPPKPLEGLPSTDPNKGSASYTKKDGIIIQLPEQTNDTQPQGPIEVEEPNATDNTIDKTTGDNTTAPQTGSENIKIYYSLLLFSGMVLLCRKPASLN